MEESTSEKYLAVLCEALNSNSVDVIYAKAPGRINLIGEHTDYNGGFVLPGAINKCLYFALTENGSKVIQAHALDLGESMSMAVDQLEKSSVDWFNYLIGIVIEFQKRGMTLRGFDCVLTSDVPIGAGLSSSAALDCAFLIGLDRFYETNLEAWEMVEMSHRSNNDFLGIKSGILDQFSSIFGKKDRLMFLDCKDRSFQYVSIPPSQYSFLLINTNVKHSHLTSAYNDRVEECNEALTAIQEVYSGFECLSDVKLLSQLESIDFPTQESSNRARFIVEENRRVLDFVKALQNADFLRCGELLYQAHDGLSAMYEVSCSELDFLVAQSRLYPEILGARMMGGGFGGCTINLIESSFIDQLKPRIMAEYYDRYGIEPSFYEVQISEGARLVLHE